MASSKEYLHFILEQLSDLEEINYRAMMGEYIIYYRDRIAGGIYDDKLLVKPTKSAVSYMTTAIYELPYEGAKEMLLVEGVDSKEYLAGLFNAIIAYELVGDYYIPVLELPDEEHYIGKYGRMHREYLKEYNPMMFNDLVLTGQLWTYLADLNKQAQSRLQLIIRQMQETENVTDELKEHGQMAWVQAMNSIYNRAEEIVIHELVLQ